MSTSSTGKPSRTIGLAVATTIGAALASCMSTCANPPKASRPPSPPKPVASSATSAAPTPTLVSVEWNLGNPRPDPEERPELHGFSRVEGLLGSPLRLGDGVLNQLCSRTMPVTISWFDGTRGAPQPVFQRLIDSYRTRHKGEAWPPVCLDWVAGSSPDGFWASFYAPYKYGHAVEPVLERWKKGRLVASRPIKHPRVFGMVWSQRTVTVVEQAPLTVDYQVIPGVASLPKHYYLEILGDRAPVRPTPLEHKVMKRCHDGSFGSRLVNVGDAAALPSGEVYLVGRDCTRKELPGAVEWWSAKARKSRFDLLPGDPKGRPELLASGKSNVWLGYGGYEAQKGETYLAHFDGTTWVQALGPPGGIASLANGPDKTLWATNDERQVWRRQPDGKWIVVNAPAASNLLIARGWMEPRPVELWLYGGNTWRRPYSELSQP